MSSLRSNSLAVVVIASLSTIALSSSNSGLDLKVTFKPSTETSEARQLLENSGSTINAQEGTSYIVRLTKPELLQQIYTEWSKNTSVSTIEVLEPRLPQVNLTQIPLSQLQSTVNSYKAAYDAWREFNGVSSEGDKKYPSLGYLEAYLQYASLRAYPNDIIDFSGYSDLARRRLNEKFSFGDPRSTGSKTGGKSAGDNSDGASSGLVQWEFLGPRNLDTPYVIYYGIRPTSGRIGALAYDPQNPNTRYLGGAQGGVWKTFDAGQNWKPMTDDWPNLCVSSLAVHPIQSNIVLAGTGDFAGGDKPGYGIMRSEDGGVKWLPTNISSGSGAISDLDVYPDDPNIVFAASGQFGSSGRVWRSTDAGKNWSATTVPVTNWSNMDIGAPDANGVRTIWAVGYGTGNVYKSIDRGVTWNQVPVSLLSGSQGAMSVAASKVFPGTAYIMSSSQNLVVKTTNSGSTWTNITTGLPTGGGYNWSQSWYDYHLETSSVVRSGQPQDIVFVSLIDVVMSDDGGSTWKSIGGTGFSATYTNNAVVHNDQHAFAINPQDPLEFMAGNDGGAYSGVYSSATRNVTWTGLSKTLGISQFYTFSMYPALPDHVMGGTQDNATPHSQNDLLNWDNVVGGDGAGCVINYQNVNIQYGSWQNHGLWRTTNAWQSRISFSPNFSGQSVPFIGDMWMDPNNPRYIYINTNYVDRYDANTNTWSFLSNAAGTPLTSGRVNALAIAPGDSNRIYAGTTNAQLWMSQNFGASWVRIDRVGQANGLPNKAITSISINPANSDEVLVGFSGGGSDHLYLCQKTTVASPTWLNRSGTNPKVLPSISLNDIARDTLEPETVWYAATDGGVWRTNDAGSTWEDITQPYGLPNVQVSKLYANPINGNIYAATYGRGIWLLRLTDGIIKTAQVFANPGYEEDSATLRIVFDKRTTSPQTLQLASSNPSVIPPMTIPVPAGVPQILVPMTVGSVNSNSVVTLTIQAQGSNSKTVEVVVYDQQLSLANSVSFVNAANVAGTVADTQSSDNQYLSWQIADPGQNQSSGVFDGQLPSLDPTGLRVDMEFSANQSSLPFKTYLFDWSQNQYILIGSGTVPRNVDGQANLTVAGDPSRYLDANGNFRMKLDVRNTLFAPNYLFRLDKLQFRFR